MANGAQTMHRALGWIALFLAVIVVSGCSILRGNRAPTASFTASYEKGYVPLEASFDALGSSDPDGDSLTYAWSFGDGSTGSGSQTTHTYDNAGSYEVVLRVTDPEGLEATTVSTIEVLAVPEGSVVLRFSWTWEGEVQRLDFAAPWNLYQTYRGRLRTPLVDNYNYGDFVNDPLDDPTLEDLADELWNRAGGDAATATFVDYTLVFVQCSIEYQADPPGSEWPLYPLETLVDRTGDCEDTSILLVSLLLAKGVASRLAFVDTDKDGTPDHVLVLVPYEDSYTGTACEEGLTILELDGDLYVVAETTRSGDGVGCDPWGLEEDDLIEVWTF